MDDADEWRCFQCGRVYYPSRTLEQIRLDELELAASMCDGESAADGVRRKLRRSARHLDPGIAATKFNEEQWWSKNEQVIYHLDQGLKVREIAEIVGRGPRQIRVVRERLRDLRSAEPELVGAD